MSPQCLKIFNTFDKNIGRKLTRSDLYNKTKVFNVPARIFELRDMGIKIKSVHKEIIGKSYPAYIME